MVLSKAFPVYLLTREKTMTFSCLALSLFGDKALFDDYFQAETVTRIFIIKLIFRNSLDSFFKKSPICSQRGRLKGDYFAGNIPFLII
jgi:hypothetical protein